MTLAPLLCTPRYQPYVWGGRNLARVLGRTLPPSGPVAESWEVFDLDDAATEIESEPGSTLRDIIRRDPGALLGATGYPRDDGSRRFPLLVKYLDAHGLLSVQVHPGDEYARQHEGGSPGKTEMWLILAAAPGAELYAGLRAGVQRDDLWAAIGEERSPEVIRSHAVRPGDVVLVPAGRVHALGGGIVALEIQQTSNVTYRLHDWGRVGSDGMPRPLHVEQALQVIDFDDVADPVLCPVERNEPWGTRRLLAATPYFLTESWEAETTVETCTSGSSPDIVMAVAGSVSVRVDGGELAVHSGRTAIIPAAVGDYAVEPHGQCAVVRARVPDLDRGLEDWLPSPGGGDAAERERVLAVCDRRVSARVTATRDR